MKKIDLNTKQIFFALALPAILVLGFNNCGALKGQEEVEAANNSGILPPIQDVSDESVVNRIGATVQTKDFSAIFNSMAEASGVGKAACEQEFEDDFKAAFPTTNDILAYGTSGQGAAMKLAACFCDEGVINNTNGARATMAAGFDFNQTGNALAGNLAQKQLLVDSITDRAWGAGITSVPATAKQELLNLIDGTLNQDGAGGANTSTRRAAFSVCVAALSSLPAMIQ